MLKSVRKAGSDVVGLDWHVNLGKARDMLGPEIAVQGNLDPTVLYAPKAHIEREVKRILDENAGRPGHISRPRQRRPTPGPEPSRSVPAAPATAAR